MSRIANNRNLIFEQFWKMTWKEKKLFILMLVERKHTERSRNRKNPDTSTYNFLKKKPDGTKLRVCKTLFANTLAIKQWTINNWLKQNFNTLHENISQKQNQPAV